jgi:nicotinate-nucleotide pyrophosphorylase (carboxylating)
MSDLNRLPLGDVFKELSSTGFVRRVLELARDEDVGTGDVTSEVCIDAAARGRGAVAARDAGVVAGLAAIPELVRVFGADLSVELRAGDGQSVERGTVLAHLSGSLRDLLAVERTVLNLIGRLSGIATVTAAYVRAAGGETCAAGIYDTRKTTPGLRVLEKYAVRCGGGRCLRLGLHDAVLIKDNHLAGVPVSQLAAFVSKAAGRARELSPAPAFVEVEVDTLDQLGALLALPRGVVDVVLLDNMSIEELRQAVAMRGASAARPALEASGGVSLGTVGAIARTGVERISVGAITHSAPSLDVALDVPA